MRYAIEYAFGATAYATRRTRLAAHVRNCRKKTRTWPKINPTCGGAFKCAKCGALVGWCQGGHEGSLRDEWCDKCWAKDDRKRERDGVDYDAHLAKLRRSRRPSASSKGSGA